MSIRKLAAQAALVQSLFLIVVGAVYMVALPIWGMQVSDWENTAKAAKCMVDHKSGWTVAYFSDWVFAFTTFILAGAYTQKFSRKQPWLGIMLGGWGVIASTLFFVAGTIGVYGVRMSALDYASTNSLGLSQTVQQVRFYTETAGVGAMALVTFIAALASARTKTFAKWVNLCGFASGVFYLVGFVFGAVSTALSYVTFIGALFAILFNIGVAVSFMRQEHPELTLTVSS